MGARVLLLLASVVSHAESPEQLIVEGHWKRARVLVEAMNRQTPNDARAVFLLSQVRSAFGDHETPLPLAERAAALEPRNAIYHRQVAECLGVAAQHAGIFQQALLARRFRKEIETAIALDPVNVQALRDLMEYYLLAPGIIGGDTRKATAIAERIAVADPAEGFLARARIASFHKDTVAAEGFLRSAVEARPPSYRARIALAQFYLDASASNLAEAEEQGVAAVQADRTRVDGYAILAAVYALRSNWPKLDALLAESASNVPDDLIPYRRAAERLMAAHRDAERAQRYLQVYRSQPSEGMPGI